MTKGLQGVESCFYGIGLDLGFGKGNPAGTVVQIMDAPHGELRGETEAMWRRPSPAEQRVDASRMDAFCLI